MGKALGKQTKTDIIPELKKLVHEQVKDIVATQYVDIKESMSKTQRYTGGWIQNEERNTGRGGIQEEVLLELGLHQEHKRGRISQQREQGMQHQRQPH